MSGVEFFDCLLFEKPKYNAVYLNGLGTNSRPQFFSSSSSILIAKGNIFFSFLINVVFIVPTSMIVM